MSLDSAQAAAPGRERQITAGAEAESHEIGQMRRDRHSVFVDRAGMPQQQIAVIHRQRQRAAGLELAADHVVDIGDHGLQRRHRQMHIGEALPACTVGGKERSSSFRSTIAPGRMVKARPRWITRDSRSPVLRARQ